MQALTLRQRGGRDGQAARAGLACPPHWRAILIALLTLSPFAGAATFFVSPAGDDGAPGTADGPFRTVAKAVERVHAGDTIILRDGLYPSEGFRSDGTGGWHGYASPVIISKAGAPGAWITLKAEHRWGATLDCETTRTHAGCDVYIYLKKTAAYWAFEDLVIRRGAYAGINTNEGASHIRVQGCRIENIGNRVDTGEIGIVGIGVGRDTASDWWIEGNVIHDIGRTGGRSVLNLDHGIYAQGTNVTIINNIFYHNVAGWHIQTTHGASRWLIANNTFAFPNPAVNGHIMLWDGDRPGSLSHLTIRDNIFYGAKGSAIVALADTIKGCVIEDNLTTASTMFGSNTPCSESGNYVKTDPRFVNAETQPYDFHLRAGSPAAAAGREPSDVTLDFDGLLRPRQSAVDLGAYQLPGSPRQVRTERP